VAIYALRVMSDLGGVARTRTLAARGVSEYAQRQLVAAGTVERVGRGWLALPDADAALKSAARAGVVLTCVTAARRTGLWVLAEDRPHVGAGARSQIRTTIEHVHWATPVVPRHPDSLVDRIENVLALVSRCQPYEAALAVWESALRKGLISRERMRRLALPPAARRLCAEASDWSDSGLETLVPPRLRWLGLPIRQQVWIAGHRVDFLIGDRLVLQVDGATHVGPQREEDIRHDAELLLLGYHVIRVGYGQVIGRWHEVQDAIMSAVAQGLHHRR